MKLANHAGRAVFVLGDEIADIAEVSGGQFGPDPMSVFQDWGALVDLADDVTRGTSPLVQAALGSPVPYPAQVFAIGLNYQSHADEAGMERPVFPATFTKFPASLSGPFDDIELPPGANVDWETELVVVISRRADRVAEADAWGHVAGFAVGQDITDRDLQFAAGGQYSLGKSRRGFGPVGPWLVTPDDLGDPGSLRLGCTVNGQPMQDGSTKDLIFNVPRLIEELSAVVPMLPGDLVFTGTPAGVGILRQPARFLRPGDLLETWVEGIGTLRNFCVPAHR